MFSFIKCITLWDQQLNQLCVCLPSWSRAATYSFWNSSGISWVSVFSGLIWDSIFSGLSPWSGKQNQQKDIRVAKDRIKKDLLENQFFFLVDISENLPFSFSDELFPFRVFFAFEDAFSTFSCDLSNSLASFWSVSFKSYINALKLCTLQMQ